MEDMLCLNVTNNSAKTFIYWADCQSEDLSEWIWGDDERAPHKRIENKK